MTDIGAALDFAPAAEHCDFSITPLGPFDLRAAIRFESGWEGGAFGGNDDHSVRLAFALDDFSGHALVTVSQAGTRVDGSVEGTDRFDVAARQTARIFSLDTDGRDFPAVGERDGVVGRLQAENPGFRPVCFHSPYEAAAWSIISSRSPREVARRMRTRLSAEYGATFGTQETQMHGFPLPEQLLAINGPVPGLSDEKIRRLHDVAQAALDGALDPVGLRGLTPAQADEQLQTIRGIGPFYSKLILLRAVGAVDGDITGEKRLEARVKDLYGAGADLKAVSDRWRPFRTWTGSLLRSTA
jgi:DNA-3-methyladenine glycosylase II